MQQQSSIESATAVVAFQTTLATLTGLKLLSQRRLETDREREREMLSTKQRLGVELLFSGISSSGSGDRKRQYIRRQSQTRGVEETMMFQQDDDVDIKDRDHCVISKRIFKWIAANREYYTAIGRSGWPPRLQAGPGYALTQLMAILNPQICSLDPKRQRLALAALEHSGSFTHFRLSLFLAFLCR